MPPTIRLATPEDAKQIQTIYSPYCLTPISFELEPPTVEEVRGRMARVLEFYPWLVCEVGGELVGYAYASRHRERPAYQWSVDTSVYVRLHRQRLGVGRGAIRFAVRGAAAARVRQRLCGGDAAEPGERRLARGDGIRAGRRLPAGGLQVWDLARRGMVSATGAAAAGRPAAPQSLEEVQGLAEWESALGSGIRLLRS